jgi:hypothetical protein
LKRIGSPISARVRAPVLELLDLSSESAALLLNTVDIGEQLADDLAPRFSRWQRHRLRFERQPNLIGKFRGDVMLAAPRSQLGEHQRLC